MSIFCYSFFEVLTKTAIIALKGHFARFLQWLAVITAGFAVGLAGGCRGSDESSPATAASPNPAAKYKLTTLATFNTVNGQLPYYGVITDGQGSLYGMAGINGNLGSIIFKYNASSGITTLATTAPYPASSLTTDGTGDFYGMTGAIGAGPYTAYTPGTLFKYNAGEGITTLGTFDNINQNTSTGVIIDGNGNLYGTTAAGGTNGYGAIFEYNASAGFTTLATFNGENGDQPSGLTTDGQGNFYGTTSYGGNGYDGSALSGNGTIFEYNTSNGITTLAAFNGSNGDLPYAGLLIDGSGNLFGTTYLGGTYNYGTIFEYSQSSGLTTLENFTGSNGMFPGSTLITDGQGNFYGTTYYGGSGYKISTISGSGTIFKYNAHVGISVLASFDPIAPGPTTAPSPGASGLITDGKGNFYGTTAYGGSNEVGTIFELSPTASK